MWDGNSNVGDNRISTHETMEALHEAGAVTKQSMREFEVACLTPVDIHSPEEINESQKK